MIFPVCIWSLAPSSSAPHTRTPLGPCCRPASSARCTCWDHPSARWTALGLSHGSSVTSLGPLPAHSGLPWTPLWALRASLLPQLLLGHPLPMDPLDVSRVASRCRGVRAGGLSTWGKERPGRLEIRLAASQPPAGPQGPALPGRRLLQGPGLRALLTGPWQPCSGSPFPVRQGGCAPLVPRDRCFRPSVWVSEWRRGGHTPASRLPGPLGGGPGSRPPTQPVPAPPHGPPPPSWGGAGTGRSSAAPPSAPAPHRLPARHLLGPGGPTPHRPGPGPGGHGLGSPLPEGNSPFPGSVPSPPLQGRPPCQECARGRGEALEPDLLGGRLTKAPPAPPLRYGRSGRRP